MGIKKNFIYSSILTSTNYILPFITYPYVSRVLGVTNIGICNFIDSIINYFILFSMLGISTIAIREIANCNRNRVKLSETFSNIIVLNTFTTIIAFLLLFIAINTIPILIQYKTMMYIGAFKLVFNYLLIDWLYKGIEDFKYITKRTIFVKLIYIVLIFILVRKSDDYLIYYGISVFTIVVNSIINLLYSRKIVDFSLASISIKRYLKPTLVLGLYAFLTSMYTSFNVAYLGFVSNETEVGYYSTAVKLYSILLSLYTAFTGVMLPRMSALIANNQYDDFKALINKSVNALLLFVLPIIVFSTVFAPQIIALISGPGYENAIFPMRIVMPLLLIIGYEQIIIIQVLLPMKRDRAVLINSILGASIGFMMNLLLVHSLKSTGSAIVWLMSELTVLCSGQYFVSKYLNFHFPYKEIIRYSLFSLPILFICIFISQLKVNYIYVLLIGSISLSLYYIYGYTLILKNEIVLSILKRLRFDKLKR